jgi:subtilase family serine protease
MKLLAPVVAALAVAACNSGGSSNVPATSGQSISQSHYIPQWQASGAARRACTDLRPGYAECDALISNAKTEPNTVEGLTPADLQAAYNLPSTSRGSKEIVAIVDAFDNPDTASDLSTYRSEFALGTAKFTKYNQTGEKKHYPAACTGKNAGWCVEIDLDIEMVSASCPRCTIYLIEANGADTTDLETAEAEAVTLGAHIVSNSWGCSGSDDCLGTSYFDAKGVTYLASAGDDGYGTQPPSALASVISVGGTVLSRKGSGYTESVWPDTGGGCAAGIAKPSWQTDPKCPYRTDNDVSAVACVCVALYDSFNEPGWGKVGGTSVSSPLIAGMYALAGNATKQHGGENLWTAKKKTKARDLHDITSGTDGGCPKSLGSTYLCTAGTREFGQYAAPIGWGSPNGVKAL